VKWNGRIIPIEIAPQGPDTIACCHGFTLIIEPTLLTNATQWSREYAPSIRHCTDYCTSEHLPRTSVIGILTCKTIHPDTYNSLKNHPEPGIKIIPLTVAHLEKILSIASLAYSSTHLEIKRLLNEITAALHNSHTQQDYDTKLDQVLTKFQERFLKNEKIFFIGVKAYEIVKKTTGPIIASDILTALSADPEVTHYFNSMNDIISMKDLVDAITQLGLAYSQAVLISDEEKIFERMHIDDIKSRLNALLSKIT